jgi:hypothetical protein
MSDSEWYDKPRMRMEFEQVADRAKRTIESRTTAEQGIIMKTNQT